MSQLKSGDIVSFELEEPSGHSRTGVLLSPCGYGFWDILFENIDAEGRIACNQYRQHFKKIKKLKDDNVFDWIKEKFPELLKT